MIVYAEYFRSMLATILSGKLVGFECHVINVCGQRILKFHVSNPQTFLRPIVASIKDRTFLLVYHTQPSLHEILISFFH